MGMLLHAFEQYEAAEICYRRARILDPDSFRWAYYLWVAQAIDGKNEEAAATLRGAGRLDPAYLISGRLDESQEICQALAKDDPQVAPVYYWLGLVASSRGQVASSIEHYRKACQLWPNFGTAHYALALACRKTGKTAEAVQHMAAPAVPAAQLPNAPSKPPLCLRRLPTAHYHPRRVSLGRRADGQAMMRVLRALAPAVVSAVCIEENSSRFSLARNACKNTIRTFSGTKVWW